MDYIYIYIDTESVFISYWLLQKDWTQVHSNNVPIDLFLMCLCFYNWISFYHHVYIVKFEVNKMWVKVLFYRLFIEIGIQKDVFDTCVHIWLIKSTLLKK